jgi:prepilin signal peptidase PulO-like enzyme (type II secretory pathway)
LITDFREQYIFDLNSLGLIPFGLVYSGFNMGNWPGEVHVPIGALQISMSTALASSFIAIGGAFTIFFLLNFFSRLVIGRDGFGEGDNRLLMGIGAFFGVKWMIVVFILAFVIQAALGIPFLLWQWLRHKAYSTTALLIGGFSLAVVPYFFQAQLQKSPLLLLGVVSVSGGAAMTCAFKALKQAKSLPTGLMALPFGPAIVVACLAMLFLENPVLPLLTTILHF